MGHLDTLRWNPKTTQYSTKLSSGGGAFTGWVGGLVGAASTTPVVTATSGSGTGATLNVTVNGGGTAITSALVVVAGSGYAIGDTVTVDAANLGGGTGTSVLTLTNAHFAETQVELKLPAQAPTSTNQHLGVSALNNSTDPETATLVWKESAGAALAAGVADQVVVYTGTNTAGGSANFTHSTTGLLSVAAAANTAIIESTGVTDPAIQFSSDGSTARYSIGSNFDGVGWTFNVAVGAPPLATLDALISFSHWIGSKQHRRLHFEYKLLGIRRRWSFHCVY